jgi:hypothetical protein
VSTAVYEWSYTRQMLHIRLMEAGDTNRQEELKEIFGPHFLSLSLWCRARISVYQLPLPQNDLLVLDAQRTMVIPVPLHAP